MKGNLVEETTKKEMEYKLVRKHMNKNLGFCSKYTDSGLDKSLVKILKSIPTFKNWTTKIIFELKEQLEKCMIYQTDDTTYDIHSLMENYYGKILTKDAVMNRIPKTGQKDNQKVLISDTELSKIMENFKYLKLNKPKVIGNAT